MEKPKPVGKVDADAQAVTPRPGGRGVIVIDRHGKLTHTRKQNPQSPPPAGHVVPENTRATVIGVSPAGLTAIGTSDGKINLGAHRFAQTGPHAHNHRRLGPGSAQVLARRQTTDGPRLGQRRSSLASFQRPRRDRRIEGTGADRADRFLAARRIPGGRHRSQRHGTGTVGCRPGKQLHPLEDSRREYALVAISDDDRWVAAVQKELPDHIDLWRADTGRYLGVLRAAGGSKHSLRFSNTGDQLLVFDEDGQGVVLNVPSGVDVKRFQAEKPKTGVRTMIAPDLGVTQYAGGEVTSIAPPPPPPPRRAWPQHCPRSGDASGAGSRKPPNHRLPKQPGTGPQRTGAPAEPVAFRARANHRWTGPTPEKPDAESLSRANRRPPRPTTNQPPAASTKPRPRSTRR